MKKFIKPSQIRGSIKAPASKSLMQRAIAASLLANGVSVLHNPSYCNDSLLSIKIIQSLGAKITKNEEKLIIKGGFNPKGNILNCGESGLCVRMFSPIASLYNLPLTLTGTGTLVKRPVSMIEKPLSDLGVECKTYNGFIPITIKGPLKGGSTKVNCSVSSQVLTGLLTALPLVKNNSELLVHELKSKPYIDMTISLLKDFGIEIENSDYKQFKIKGNQTYKSCEYEIEGDWSGAAFMLVAGAIRGSIQVKGIKINSKQADKQILKVLERAGAKVIIKTNSIEIKKNELKGFLFDATDCPDLFPPLVALAAHCNGISIIKGVNRLKFKESKRAEVLKNEFSNLGIEINITDDDMIIKGGTVTEGTVFSNNDHRIAMALSVASLLAKGVVGLKCPECVAKSYPEFFNDLKKIGGIIYE
ncbi:MAG: 3-phosphoshikimate 1-carboxyvinyltransferase [Bacteroidales bacterium]|nr:3-phosphoshikimate 1-carboxyvinyltransferase [Bacteroidales bacterium]